MKLVIDWDGTLAEDGEWLPGAREFLKFAARHGWKVTVASARANYPGGLAEIQATLAAARFSGIPVVGKPLADIYIDDKALAFTGSWPETRAKVQRTARTA